MARSFPCPYCKGQGEWVEAVLDDGSGPTVSCGACNGQGMIEIGSELHQRLKENNPSKDLMWEMIAEKNDALGQVIKALKELGLDGWSEAPYLLNVCQKAFSFPNSQEQNDAE
jgi:hypothetical protein